MDDRETTVTMSAECGVETRQKLGVLWPPAVYKAQAGRGYEAPRDQCSSQSDIFKHSKHIIVIRSNYVSQAGSLRLAW